ncbi:hypothetical protein KM043_012278 [Ampulex compressa]|nr:hypothetical protein KM043_012278 [Ampulex compressa]
MADRGRGFSRGRAQNVKDQKTQEFSTHGRQHVGGSVWGRRPGPPESSSAGPYMRQMPRSETIGSAVLRHEPMRHAVPGTSRESAPERMDITPSGLGGGDVVSLGRGAMRGRRILPMDILETKPKTLATKKGMAGSGVLLQSNYFKLLSMPDWCLYQYRVDFAPEEDRTAVRKGLLRLHKETLGAYIFDGTVLYTSNRLKEKLELVSKRESDDTIIKIDVRLVGDLMKGDHHYIQFFNILMRKCLEHLKLQLVGRNYFDACNRAVIPEFKLELWPGYVTSIRQHEQDMLMCTEITHKVMRNETLLDILNNCYREYGHNFKNKYTDQVIGLVVLTDYNNNTYRIEDVDFDVHPDSTFQLKSGDSISYKDYYKNKYQIRITNNSQPMLVTRTKPRDRRAGQAERVYLVPELCRATGITDAMRNQFSVMAALATHTRVPPGSRINKLLAFNRRLTNEPKISKEFTDWNLKLDTKLVEVPGRILPPTSIVLGRNVQCKVNPSADWTRDVMKRELFCTANLHDWVVVCSRHLENNTRNFVTMLKKVATELGVNVSTPAWSIINDDRSGMYAQILEQIMSRSKPSLILCVVSNNRADRYNAIKKKCIIDRPVLTQVVLGKTLTHKNVMSIATKVAIQINCKLGGAAWTMQDLPPINLMVVGFDVCHDTAVHGRDFGAMVASLDRNLTRYFSAVSAHTNGEELSNEFSVNIAKAVQNYKQLNQVLPSHILIYRDGVGEGQVPFVYEHEVGQLKSKLKHLYGETNFKMAFVIVTKRINSRLFYKGGNPVPGTVVDDVITSPIKYDFYIVSQSVKQGTVSPTSYSVISDTSGWNACQMQRLTYKLTHMYYNCTTTMRVPAPCQYAHKLAFLVAQSLNRPPSSQLDNLLYFL